ncbi:MAG TPA: C_GCAxxG_C_C family protein [Clostridiales bacterium]|nr:C_GCAxxG_C_C family protein [Clostridiales bacterium]
MKSRVDEVLECFNNGFDCSQAILSTYCEEFGLDKETALKLSSGLAAGMGRLCQTCGAVTGAYLVIGLKHGKLSAYDNNAKEKTFELVQEFEKQFVKRNKSTNCLELLGVDLRNGDKEKAVIQVKQVCPKAVKDAAEILEAVLEMV